MIFKKIKAKFIQTLRLAFLNRKHFFGSYADNQIDMRKWKADSGVMVQYIEDNRMKFTPVVNAGEKPDVLRELVKEQARQYNRNLRKKHNCTVWYVEDHAFAKWLGWKRGREDHALSDRVMPKSIYTR